MTETPRRVRISHPNAQAVRRPRGQPPGRDLHEQTAVGELLTRSLVRAQLVLALRMIVVVGVLIGGLPLLFALAPAARSARVFGMPLPWLVLGLLVYPVLVAVGWTYTRLAERTERELADMVDRL